MGALEVVEVDGVSHTWGEHCAAHDVKPTTAHRRLKAGWTVRQTLGMDPPPPSSSDHGLVYFRGEYRTMKDWAGVVGISAKILGDRILSGMTSEQALSLPAQAPHSRRAVLGSDANMARILDRVADELGVTRQAVQQTINRALGRYQRAQLADRCLAWRGPNGEQLSDDEIAELIACVAAEPEFKAYLFRSDLDVAPLCAAMLRLSAHDRMKATASCEMLPAWSHAA